MVVHVNGEVMSQVDKFLQSFVDEDDADEASKGLFSEAGDIADQGAGICGNQYEAEEGCPQANAGPQ